MSDPDQQSVERARKGSPRASRELVDRHGPYLRTLILRLVGDAHDADDMVQETFLRAFRGLHRFNGRATFRTWITRIALNSCMTLLSERSRAPADLAEGSAPAHTPRPEAAMLREEVYARITRALDTLTPMERTAWVMRHEEGTSVGEVSRLLGVSNEAARQSISRAAQKLRRHLHSTRREIR